MLQVNRQNYKSTLFYENKVATKKQHSDQLFEATQKFTTAQKQELAELIKFVSIATRMEHSNNHANQYKVTKDNIAAKLGSLGVIDITEVNKLTDNIINLALIESSRGAGLKEVFVGHRTMSQHAKEFIVNKLGIPLSLMEIRSADIDKILSNPKTETTNVRLQKLLNYFKPQTLNNNQGKLGKSYDKSHEILENKVKQIKNNVSAELIDRARTDGYIVYKTKNILSLEKTERGSEVNLNNTAIDKAGAKILCRQLSFQQLKSHKDYVHKFITKEKIEQELLLKENVFDSDQIMYRADEYHYMQNHREIGDVLYKIAKNHGSTSLLFNSSNHSMAITVLNKGDGTFILKFFDPNNTHTHKRVLCKDIEAIRNLKLSDLLPDSDINLYYEDLDSTMIALYKNPDKISKPLHSVNKFTNMDHQTLDLNLLKSGIMLRSIDFNIPDMLTAGFNFLSNNQKELGTTVQQLLSLTNLNGIPGLYVALQSGHADTIKAYLEGIKNLNLSKKELKELIAAKSDEGVPGLYIALQRGHPETVKVYLEGIKNLNLSKEELRDIISAKNDEEMSGSYLAFQAGHSDTIKVYLEGLKNLNLSKEELRDLIKVLPKGYTMNGLQLAMHMGHVETVKTYFEVLGSFGLSKEELKGLIQAETGDDVLELKIAQKRKESSLAAKAYLEGLNKLGLTLADLKAR